MTTPTGRVGPRLSQTRVARPPSRVPSPLAMVMEMGPGRGLLSRTYASPSRARARTRDATTPTPNLAEYITAALTERGMTPAQLARASKLSEAAISLLLSGEIKNAKTRTLCALARGLDIDPRELIHPSCRTASAA